MTRAQRNNLRDAVTSAAELVGQAYDRLGSDLPRRRCPRRQAIQAVREEINKASIALNHLLTTIDTDELRRDC